MTGRPDLDALAPLLLDDRGRLRPEIRRMIAVPFRCKTRHRHLQGGIIRTVHGPVLIWRSERGPATRWQWMRDWLGDMPGTVLMTCHCRGSTPVDLTPYQGQVR